MPPVITTEEEVKPVNVLETLNKIQQALKVPKGQMNSFGGYKYRSCEDILEAIKPLLGTATLTITDEVVMIGARYYVKAVATISELAQSAQVVAYAREPEEKKGMDVAQITGATSSYARKYALNGLFCIDDTKDPDATNKHDDEANSPEKGGKKGKVFVPKVEKGKIVNKPEADDIPFDDVSSSGDDI